MKHRRSARPRDREGYVSLLAMSFAFGLAVFGTAMAVGLRAYLSAAAAEARDIRIRIALESAAASALGELAVEGAVKPHYETNFAGDRQTVLVTLTGVKVDPAWDSAKVVADAARPVGLVLDPDFAATAAGLANLSSHHRLNASREDCLRRVFTYGRGGAPRMEESVATGSHAIRAGEQVDVRVQASSGPVLWMRARITGGDTGWRLHDYRRLHGVTACV